MLKDHKKTILITGATGAIGQALARLYASPDAVLVLHARNIENLSDIKSQCQAQGAEVSCFEFDCEDIDAIQPKLESMLAGRQIDLAILNAGVNEFPEQHEAIESVEVGLHVLNVNLKANMVLTTVLIRHMAYGGQIALMSSLAAFYGLPLTPAYSASKAGIKAYGEALRPNLAQIGIKLSVIMPGYIRSAMCDAMPGPKPFMRSPDYAARKIKSGLERNKPRIAFPLPLVFGTWLLAVVPASLANMLLRVFGYDRACK